MDILKIIFVVCLLPLATFAQQEKAEVHMSPQIEELVSKRVDLYKSKPGISGYRIQIFFGSQRSQANDVRNEFMSVHPEVESYLLYQQPYFKVRVGNFRTRIEAYKLYAEILKDFPSVFLVEDEINMPKLSE